MHTQIQLNLGTQTNSCWLLSDFQPSSVLNDAEDFTKAQVALCKLMHPNAVYKAGLEIPREPALS